MSAPDLELARERIQEANAIVALRFQKYSSDPEARLLIAVLLMDLETLQGRLSFVQNRLNALDQVQALMLVTED